MSIIPLSHALFGVIVAVCATISAGQGSTVPEHVSQKAHVWLKADPSGLQRTDAKQVDAQGRLQLWYDQSGNGNNAVATTQDQNDRPKLIQGHTENELGKFSYGQHMVRFGEAKMTSLEFEKPLHVSGDLGGFSMSAVVSSDRNDGSSKSGLFDMGIYPTNGFGMGYSQASAGAYVATGMDGTQVDAKIADPCGDLKVVTVDVKFARPARACRHGQVEFLVSGQKYCTGELKMYVNGQLQASDTKLKLTSLDKDAVYYYSKLKNSGTTKSGRPAVLGALADGSGYFRGDLGEFLFFGRAVSDTERIDTELYLMRKFYINPMKAECTGSGGDAAAACTGKSKTECEAQFWNVPGDAAGEACNPSDGSKKCYCKFKGNPSVCEHPATFDFYAYDSYSVYFNGALLKTHKPQNTQAGPSSLQTVRVYLPKVPACGDVVAIYSEISSNQKFRGIKGFITAEKWSGNSDPIAVTDSTWRCSATDDSYPSRDGFSHEEWFSVGYPDHSWDQASFDNGVLNDPSQNPGNSEAKWIWALNNVNDGQTSPTNATSAYCRLSMSVAVDSVTPDEAVYNSGDLVTITGRSFGLSQADELPSVNFPLFGACANVQRVAGTSRKVTCNVPKLSSRSAGTSKEAHVTVARRNEMCHEWVEHPDAQELSMPDVCTGATCPYDGIREAYTKPVPFTFKCACTGTLSAQPPHRGYRECTNTTCSLA
jgi:hypothetical protein